MAKIIPIATFQPKDHAIASLFAIGDAGMVLNDTPVEVLADIQVKDIDGDIISAQRAIFRVVSCLHKIALRLEKHRVEKMVEINLIEKWRVRP